PRWSTSACESERDGGWPYAPPMLLGVVAHLAPTCDATATGTSSGPTPGPGRGRSEPRTPPAMCGLAEAGGSGFASTIHRYDARYSLRNRTRSSGPVHLAYREPNGCRWMR